MIPLIVRAVPGGKPVLNRQKVVIALLQATDRPVSRTELMKWCFLLSRETASGGGTAFYQFLPYRWGPFSFCLDREIGTLVRQGLVRETEQDRWELAETGEAASNSLAGPVQADIRRLVDRFSRAPLDRLVGYVYRKYPWFTVNSEKEQRESRPVAPAAVYTAGYEGCLVDGFLDRLLRAGIQQITDVRHNPISRQYGFHKSTLNRLCSNVGIDYLHMPELGIPSALRRHLRTEADYADLFDRYKAQLSLEKAPFVRRIAAAMKQEATALVCMEAEPSRCHRSRLAEAVSRRNNLEVVHL